ncbi:MAG: PAS domain S-box protein [Gammaproteobacteria bacterium]
MNLPHSDLHADSASADWLRQILDNSTAVVYLKDAAGRYLFVNQRLLEVFGLDASAVIGHRDSDIFAAEIAAGFRVNDTHVLERNAPVEFEERARLTDGEHVFLSVKFPLRDAAGRPYAVCGISTDITDRKRIEQALRDVALGVTGATGQDIFQSIARHLAASLGVDFAFVGKLVVGPPRRIQTLAICSDGQYIDNMQYDLVGTPCQTVVGQEFQYVPRDICACYPGDNMLSQMGFESYAGYPLFDSHGQALGLIAVLHRGPLREPEFIEAILRIFSVRAASELERLRTEEAQRASEASYRAIFEASQDAIFVHDIDTGTIVDVNPTACQVYGYSYEEMLELSVADLSSGVPPYTLRDAIKYINKVKAGEPQRFEWHRRNKDGSLHWDEVLLQIARIGGVDRVVAFTRDITARKQAEDARNRLEAQLRQAQKMEAIGHLTGGIAHDFNNILTGVMGYIVLAEERVRAQGDAKLLGYLERAQRSGQRARDLIQQMLTFSRGQRGEPRPLQLAPLIKETVKLLGATLPSSIEIATRLDCDAPRALLDPVQVEQVLMNLCINARDAMQGSGRIEVRLSEVAHDGQSCAGCRQAVAGRYVEICVSDSGPGIPPEVLERMFEPFFSTKEAGKGSGMGLATVHGIVHEHGGHVLVDSAPGQGARFRVLFPPLAGAAETASANVAAASGARHGPQLAGRVLVVDDDESAGDFMGDLLETWGLTPTVLRESPEALDMLRARPDAFDLVVLDLTMPRMNGLDLARRLRALRADLPLILYSGYSEGVTEAQLRAAGVDARVRKPVDTDELLDILRRLLLAAS